MSFDPSKSKYEMPASDLTDAQNIVLSVLSIPVCVMSVCASSVLICMVIKTWKSSLDRILLCMSLYDICWSIQACLQGFLAPPDNSQRVTALGNDASCNALGFLFQFSGNVFWYNGMLSFYYLVTIVYGWTEQHFERIAPYLHVVIFAYSFCTATLGLVREWYYPLDIGGGCWISHYPRGCTGDECRSDEIGWIVAGYPVLCMMLLVIVSNVMIYFHVRRTMRRSVGHSFTNTMAVSQSKRIRQVAIQCFLYVLVFWCTIMPWIVIRGLDGADYTADNESKIFPILVLNSLAAPSTGCFNLLVYLRPQYRKCRRDNPDRSYFWVLRRTIFGNLVETNSQNSNLSEQSRRPVQRSSTMQLANEEKREQSIDKDETTALSLKHEEALSVSNVCRHLAPSKKEPETT